MEEFTRMIFQQWLQSGDYKDMYHEKGHELLFEMEKVLSTDLCNKFYNMFSDCCYENNEIAFINGFSYAVKCISAGKIEIEKAFLREEICESDIH